MKAAIIILGNQWVCPYVNTYRRIFDKLGCSYDVILWDRDGSDASAPIKYSSGKANLDNPVVKAWHYVRYADFIKKTVSRNGYDRLVVSGPHLAILLSGILRRRYKGRYVIDYRDISVEQHLLLGGVYSKVLEGVHCYPRPAEGRPAFCRLQGFRRAKGLIRWCVGRREREELQHRQACRHRESEWRESLARRQS